MKRLELFFSGRRPQSKPPETGALDVCDAAATDDDCNDYGDNKKHCNAPLHQETS